MAGSGNPIGGPRPEKIARAFSVAVALLAAGTVIAIIALWPGDVDAPVSEGLAGDTERATIDSVTYEACPPPQTGRCGTAEAQLEGGPDEGELTTLTLGGAGPEPELAPGDEVRVTRAEGGPTATATYTLADFERRGPMLWLAVVFAALVVLFGRLRGALSLVGLAISLAVVVAFIVPAILDGAAPLVVAIVGSMAIMLATVSLAHGMGPKSLAAMLGTAVSLALVALLALAFTNLAHITGLSSEEAAILLQGGADVSLDGLLLAGIVIAALGVLDDVTVSQSSTVLALRAANPRLGFRELYGAALRVGRDHVSATVNTLVLAYVGASLPLLLIFSSGEIGIVDAVSTELIAKEVVGTLVGSIGLIAAVPITTALAALLAPGAAADRASTA